MTLDINLPELGDDIKEGTVVSLAFKPGDTINSGATLAEIETDKAVLGVPSSEEGNLVEWFVKEGDTIKVGDKLCKIEASSSKSNSISDKNNEQNENQVSSETSKRESSDATLSSGDSSKSNQNVSTKSDPASKKEVNFTDLGDGISGGTVVSLLVKIGDQVKEGDALLELETDKAVVPFPSPVSGKVNYIFVREGQEIKVGDKGLVIETTSDKSESPAQAESSTNINQGTDSSTNESATTGDVPSVPEPPKVQKITDLPATANADYRSLDLSSVLAGPATRKLARELGVDINHISSGSGRGGRITQDDVKKYVKRIVSSGTSNAGTGALSSKELPDFSKWGDVKREKTSKLRDTIANAITYAWQAIPHVHQYDNIYIDNILALQKKWKEDFASKGSSLSVTPFIIKALAQCLKDFPTFNSSYDPRSKEVIFKHYFNVGVAVDTPQGLIVPVIKNVDTLSIFDIGKTLKTVAKSTRERTVNPEDLRGGCISLSNLGGIGGTHFNPIINWPEVAILGVGQGSFVPVYHKDKKEFIPSMVLPTCLAYDHRVIDGADGARFMVKLKHYLENPDLLLMGIK